MKKIIALTLVLVMACQFSFACAAEADPRYTGVWYTKTLAEGDEAYNVAELGVKIVLTLGADWTCRLVGAGYDVTGNWMDSNGSVSLNFDGDMAELSLSGEELILEAGESYTMTFTREPPKENNAMLEAILAAQAAEAGKDGETAGETEAEKITEAVETAETAETAEAAETDEAAETAEKAAETAGKFNGRWTATAVSYNDLELDRAGAEAAGVELPEMTFHDGVITMEGGLIAEMFQPINRPLTYEADTGSFAAELAGVSLTAAMPRDGVMTVTVTVGGTDTALTFEKAD